MKPVRLRTGNACPAVSAIDRNMNCCELLASTGVRLFQQRQLVLLILVTAQQWYPVGNKTVNEARTSSYAHLHCSILTRHRKDSAVLDPILPPCTRTCNNLTRNLTYGSQSTRKYKLSLSSKSLGTSAPHPEPRSKLRRLKPQHVRLHFHTKSRAPGPSVETGLAPHATSIARG